MRLRHAFSMATATAACALLTACGGSGTSGSSTAEPDGHSTRIHMLAAPAGQFTTTQNHDGALRGTLTLHNPQPDVLWYSDRPERETGEISLGSYLGSGWQAAYGQIPPNATLQFLPEGGSHIAGLYLSLSEPVHNQATNTVSFQAHVLNDTLVDALPASMAFSNATLNVLNNSEDDQEVSSYVQHAAQATLRPAGGTGEHELVLNQAGPNMFWVDNAPGTYSDSRPMSEFFAQWPYVFADSPPNAALLGTTPSGGLGLYFLTLTNPVHDESTHELRYTATMLGEHHGALETLSQAVLLIDSGKFSRFPFPGKGIAYQAFGHGYNPSTANTTNLYFGSDIARKQFGSLWGTQSYLSQSCAPDCRNDLQTIKDMGVNLIRLYDWDPRNDHSQFLDYAHALGIKVVVPISNWLPKQGPGVWANALAEYFDPRNFGNRDKSDWHPAIAGVIISNELDTLENGHDYFDNVLDLTADFIKKADELKFSKSVPVGIPVTFAMNEGKRPSWHHFDRMMGHSYLANHKDRLMLNPQTYNPRDFLFGKAGNNDGWVQQTYERYGIPILFTEIGANRIDDATAPTTILEQLTGVIEYQQQHPDQLLGAILFQFSNKIWMQTDPDSIPDGSYGTFRHGNTIRSIQTVGEDYTFWDGQTNGVLAIDRLEPTITHDSVINAYK